MECERIFRMVVDKTGQISVYSDSQSRNNCTLSVVLCPMSPMPRYYCSSSGLYRVRVVSDLSAHSRLRPVKTTTTKAQSVSVDTPKPALAPLPAERRRLHR